MLAARAENTITLNSDNGSPVPRPQASWDSATNPKFSIELGETTLRLTFPSVTNVPYIEESNYKDFILKVSGQFTNNAFTERYFVRRRLLNAAGFQWQLEPRPPEPPITMPPQAVNRRDDETRLAIAAIELARARSVGGSAEGYSAAVRWLMSIGSDKQLSNLARECATSIISEYPAAISASKEMTVDELYAWATDGRYRNPEAEKALVNFRKEVVRGVITQPPPPLQTGQNSPPPPPAGFNRQSPAPQTDEQMPAVRGVR